MTDNSTGSGRKPGTVELSILMPCLNEIETLAACIGKAQDYLERSGVASPPRFGRLQEIRFSTNSKLLMRIQSYPWCEC